VLLLASNPRSATRGTISGPRRLRDRRTSAQRRRSYRLRFACVHPTEENHDSLSFLLRLGNAPDVQRLFTFRPNGIAKGGDGGGPVHPGRPIELSVLGSAHCCCTEHGARATRCIVEARVFRQVGLSRALGGNQAQASRYAGRPERLERLRAGNIVPHERKRLDRSLRFPSQPAIRRRHVWYRPSTRLANQSVVSLRVIFGLCSPICGSTARGADPPAI